MCFPIKDAIEKEWEGLDGARRPGRPVNAVEMKPTAVHGSGARAERI